jgi:hypothetical protein
LYFSGGGYLSRAEVQTLDETDETLAFQLGYTNHRKFSDNSPISRTKAFYSPVFRGEILPSLTGNG